MARVHAGKFPIDVTGYRPGSPCIRNIECDSNHCGTAESVSLCFGSECRANDDCSKGQRCDLGICTNLAGSCEVCDIDGDCESNFCSKYKVCGGSDGKIDNGCVCYKDNECRSGRCDEGWFSAGKCQTKLFNGASCAQHSDCYSGYCSWLFVCKESGRRRQLQVKSRLKSDFKLDDDDDDATGDDKSDDKTDDAADDDSAKSKSKKKKSHFSFGGLIKAFLAAMISVIVIMTLYVLARVRPRGYDEIPTALNV